MFRLLVFTTFNNRQVAPPDWPAHLPKPDAQQTLRRAAQEVKELRAKFGPTHPEVRKHKQTAELFLRWINTDFPGKFDSLFGKPQRQTNPLPFSHDAEEFHQHEEEAASLAAELHEFRTAASTPELDAKRTELTRTTERCRERRFLCSAGNTKSGSRCSERITGTDRSPDRKKSRYPRTDCRSTRRRTAADNSRRCLGSGNGARSV